MKKIVFAAPFVILISLAAIIAWANLSTVESGIPEDYSKEDAEEFKGEENIKTAWNHWTKSGEFHEEDYEKNLTFIALRSIDDSQMEALGMSREISEMQKTIGLMNGNPMALSEAERAAYHSAFEQKLEAAYNSIN
ncbi:hypothetical protein A1A1_18610 [Planococcus antarcticus DSM 14505]|uniref:Uncharacterized protein n=1 Tax=Planococcus antarcticus DSM 14505 TaxID=1185653 RepID=A0A1C7DHI8_9BACL|nr:hypothetical protein [Planococcus antarcticus]ANU10877.1 hypothetical protein BBH88_11420 [Planococcus antarcticus DSM 14505]EIM04983.1 hypothetical protein A1A1_18610 [Planococcus antarcticus DSM 14505]